jgi:hypothetical protein
LTTYVRLTMRLSAALLLVWLLVPVGAVHGQTGVGSVREAGALRDTFDPAGEQPFRLRPFVLQGSVQISVAGARLDSMRYRIDYRHGRLWIDHPSLVGSVVVTYRTFPFQFQDAYTRPHLRAPLAADTASSSAEAQAVPTRSTPDPFGNVRLQRSGSII